MKTRLDLHNELCTLLGSSYAYFEPPKSLSITYPCFIYEMNPGSVLKADNGLYHFEPNYQLTYITDDPETDMPITVLSHFKKCRHNRSFVADNLHHHIFYLYY